MTENFEMVAKTLYGFEDLLVDELNGLGAQAVKKGVRHVSFVGDKGFMYKANLALRTAIKVLKPIQSFKVFNEDGLYRKTKDLPWEDFLRDTQDLRNECGHLSDEEYYQRQSSFRTGLMARPKFYMTDYFYERYEQQARDNLDRYFARAEDTNP